MDEILIDKMQFYGKKWLTRLSIALAIFLMIPTVAIMATWNTLPGEKLYPTKRILEGIALRLVGNNFAARTDLQTQFVAQRFNEAEELLNQSSNAGLEELLQQIQTTKKDIISARKKTGTKDAELAQQKAEKLTVQLRDYSSRLEEKKQVSNLETNQVKPEVVVSNPRVTQSPTQTTTLIAQTTTVETVQQEMATIIVELEAQHDVENRGNVKVDNGVRDNKEKRGKD